MPAPRKASIDLHPTALLRKVSHALLDHRSDYRSDLLHDSRQCEVAHDQAPRVLLRSNPGRVRTNGSLRHLVVLADRDWSPRRLRRFIRSQATLKASQEAGRRAQERWQCQLLLLRRTAPQVKIRPNGCMCVFARNH